MSADPEFEGGEEPRTDEPPNRHKGKTATCPECGKTGPSTTIYRHRVKDHGVQARAKHGKKMEGIGPSLVEQIEMVYRLGGQVAISRNLPATGNTIQAQARPCAVAWDQLLDAYFPGLKEMLEKGMVATSVVALIYAHIPIVQVARAEIEQRRIIEPVATEPTSAF